jgi:cytochrome c556
LTKLMEEVQVLFKPLQEAARFSKAKFESDAKHEELARKANRLAELMKQTEKFSPEKDAPDKPKKDWLDTCQASAQHARELAEAAKKKDYSAYRGAFKRMDAACTRCHEIFR